MAAANCISMEQPGDGGRQVYVMRVAVLGGTRFIGPAIVDQLRSGGHEVVVLHKGTTDPHRRDVSDVRLDRANRDALRTALAQAGADVLIDTCAYTRQDAETAIAALPRGLRAVVLSSMDVYRAFGSYLTAQSTDPVPLTEAAPLRTHRFPYRGFPFPRAGIDPETYDKIHVEEPYLDAGAVVLRLPTVFGERDPWCWEGFVLSRVMAGREQIPIGEGTWVCSRVWVQDVASAVALAAWSDLEGEVLNIAEAQTWTVEQWARAILEASASSAELVHVPDNVLPFDLRISARTSQHLLLDSSRARRLLGWSDCDPREAVSASVAWHTAHPGPNLSWDFSADNQALDAVLGSSAR